MTTNRQSVRWSSRSRRRREEKACPERTSFSPLYTPSPLSSPNPTSSPSLLVSRFTVLLTQMYPFNPTIKSTPIEGREWKWDFARTTSAGGTVTSRPFLSCKGAKAGAGAAGGCQSRPGEAVRVTARKGRTRLAVSQRAGMQTHGAVSEKGLHLGDEQVPLLEKGPHLQLVRFEFSSLREGGGASGRESGVLEKGAEECPPYLDASGQVDGREHQDGVLRGVHFDFPAFRSDLEGAARMGQVPPAWV